MSRIQNILLQILDSSLLHNRREVKVAVVCFAASIAFWFLNALNRDYATLISYPVEFRQAQGKDSIRLHRVQVQLRVKGQGWNILKRNALFKPQPVIYWAAGEQKVSPVHLQAAFAKQFSDLQVQQISLPTLP
jgi:hypothetical protein